MVLQTRPLVGLCFRLSRNKHSKKKNQMWRYVLPLRVWFDKNENVSENPISASFSPTINVNFNACYSIGFRSVHIDSLIQINKRTFCASQSMWHIIADYLEHTRSHWLNGNDKTDRTVTRAPAFHFNIYSCSCSCYDCRFFPHSIYVCRVWSDGPIRVTLQQWQTPMLNSSSAIDVGRVICAFTVTAAEYFTSCESHVYFTSRLFLRNDGLPFSSHAWLLWFLRLFFFHIHKMCDIDECFVPNNGGSNPFIIVILRMLHRNLCCPLFFFSFFSGSFCFVLFCYSFTAVRGTE